MERTWRVPDRWLDTPRRGEIVEGTQFVPFKAPLDSRYDVGAATFNMDMLLKRIPNIGMIIDLSYTTRYYDSEAVMAKHPGLSIVKVKCSGHKESPQIEQVSTFINVCQLFWKKNPTKLIGVHCTHGYNRTGFMIVAYMVEELDLQVQLAVRRFRDARNPGIYKDHYIQDLIHRYDGPDGDTEGLIPVQKPEWCISQREDEEEVDGAAVLVQNLLTYLSSLPQEMCSPDTQKKIEDDITMILSATNNSALGNCLSQYGWIGDSFTSPIADPLEMVKVLKEAFPTLNSSGRKRKVREEEDPKSAYCETDEAVPLGPFAADPNGQQMNGIKPVPPPHQGRLRKMCREMVGAKTGTSFPGAQPVSLDNTNMNLILTEEYLVSWKADGTRYLMLILGNRGVFMVGRDNTVFEVKSRHGSGPGILFPKEDGTLVDGTLVDGELVFDKDPKSKKLRPRFLLFDLVCYEGKGYHDEPYTTRLEAINKYLIKPKGIDARKKQRPPEVMGIRLKLFFPLQEIDRKLKGIISQVTHETDGYIFGPVHQRYESGSCAKLLKWKPPDMNSIDFLMKVSTLETGNVCGTLYVGFQGSVTNFRGANIIVPEKHGKRLKELNGKIVECKWDKSIQKWKYMKTRTDKTHPNALRTAENVFRSIEHGIRKEDLIVRIKSALERRKARPTQH